MKSRSSLSLVVAFALVLFAAVAVAGCKKEDVEEVELDRITATLDTDGYALFKVSPNSAARIAVLVEMRDAPPGTYVLLHSRQAPKSVGWFSLDIDAYAPCRRFGKDAVDETELDCLVPDGRGEIVDLVTVSSMRLLPPAANDSGDPAKLPRQTDTTVLRHDIAKVYVTPRSPEYYAIMRVERATARGLFSFETREIDGSSSLSDDPTVRQIIRETN